jgi:hypothetical protein
VVGRRPSGRGGSTKGRPSPIRRAPSRASSAPSIGGDSGSVTSTPQITIPKLNGDPTWSLCPWPVTVDVEGTTFTVEAVPAVAWLKFLMRPEPDLTGLLTELFPGLEDFFFDEELDLQEMYDLLLEVIATVSARPWWVTIRLIAVAYHHWAVLGPQMLTQADAESLSLAAWLDILTVTVIESMKPERVAMFTLQLEAAPSFNGDDAAPVDHMASMEMDRNAFLAAAR